MVEGESHSDGAFAMLWLTKIQILEWATASGTRVLVALK